MSQEQFELICKILQNGAPALANELIIALDTLVKEYLALKKNTEKPDTVKKK